MSRILAVVGKDIKQITRNRFMAVITLLSIFVFALIYYLLPGNVEEQLDIGLFIEKGRSAVEDELEEEEGLKVTWADSQAELKRLVIDGDVQVGFAFTFSDSKARARQYISAETPDEIREAGGAIGREFAAALAGGALPIELEEKVVGPDLTGRQVPLRDELRILFLVMVLLVEIYALANLLVDEIRQRTVKALLVTPLSIGDFMSAKSVTGISLAFSESILMALLVGAMTLGTALPVILLLFLGAVLVTGIAFFVGASSADMFGIIAKATVVFIVLALPAVSLIFPGVSTPYIALLPTDALIQSLNGVVNQGFALDTFRTELAVLFLWDALLFTLGFWLLRRRLA